MPAAAATILIIDDESLITRSVARHLRRHGFEVLVAEDGQEGLSCFFFNADRIRVILLDMDLPTVSGGECLRQIRAGDYDVKVIVQSGGDALAGDDLHAVDADLFLPKPYDVTELVSLIEGLIA